MMAYCLFNNQKFITKNLHGHEMNKSWIFTRQQPNVPAPSAISNDFSRTSSIRFCLWDKLIFPCSITDFRFKASNCRKGNHQSREQPARHKFGQQKTALIMFKYMKLVHVTRIQKFNESAGLCAKEHHQFPQTSKPLSYLRKQKGSELY